MWNIPCTISSRQNMVGSLNLSESILYATSEMHRSLSSKRISLVEYEGCLYYFISCSSLALFFWTWQRYPCKLESPTKYVFLSNILFKLSSNYNVSDICELKWKSSIDAFAISDLSIFASILKISSKIISTHVPAVWLKLVTVSFF